MRLSAAGAGVGSLFAGVETPSVQEAGYNFFNDCCDMSFLVHRDNPLLGQSVQHMNWCVAAIGEAGDNAFAAAGVAEGWDKTQCSVSFTDASGTGKLPVLIAQRSFTQNAF